MDVIHAQFVHVDDSWGVVREVWATWLMTQDTARLRVGMLSSAATSAIRESCKIRVIPGLEGQRLPLWTCLRQLLPSVCERLRANGRRGGAVYERVTLHRCSLGSIILR